MKVTCTIEMPEVKSKATFMRELQVMLNDYEDNNENAKDIHISNVIVVTDRL